MNKIFRSLSRGIPALKRFVGLSSGLGSIVIASINLFVLFSFEHRSPSTALLNINFLSLLAVGAIWTVSAFIRTSIAIWVQIVVFLLITLMTAVSSHPGNVTSALFLLYTLVLLVEYRLKPRLIYAAASVITIAFVAALTIGYRSHTAGWIPVTINSLILVALFVLLYGGVLARHWIRHREEAELLESRVKARTADLEKALGERVVMLQEIHHRVKNNLQIVASLLRLETNRLPEDDVARRPMETSIQRIHAMALVHEMLYQSEEFRCVELGSYARELIGAISSAVAARVTYEPPPDKPIEVDLDFAIPFGLLLNELIATAAGHAFGPNAARTIKVQLNCNSQVELVVEDDGAGTPETEETDAGRSLALTLVHSLVEQMHGRIELLSSFGTRWRVTIPLKEPRPDSDSNT